MDDFTPLPIEYDPSTKLVAGTKTPIPAALAAELSALNALHKALTAGPAASDGGGGTMSHVAPPPPTAANPKRSAQVAKLRDSGNASLRAGKPADAVRLYTLGLDMAAGRPGWEPVDLARDELAQLYANRAQAHMAARDWALGAVDAECSVELKRQGNTKAWWRRAKCLLEMGRLDEAERWVGEAVEFEGEEADLLEIGRAVRKAQERAAGGKGN
jgi:translocation protein SEC72